MFDKLGLLCHGEVLRESGGRRVPRPTGLGTSEIGDVVYRDIRCTEPRENPDLGSNLGGDPNCGERNTETTLTLHLPRL